MIREEWIGVRLSKDININDLQATVIYHRRDGGNWTDPIVTNNIIGCNINLEIGRGR